MLGRFYLRNFNKNMISVPTQVRKMSDYSKIISNLHPSQMDALTEELIIVDENDNKISSISKVDGHLKSKNNKFPHRAFSVFL